MHNPEAHGKPKYDEQFIALEPLDVNKIHSFDELLSAMDKTAFAGRKTGEAASILMEMIMDPDCFVVGTFSGAMSVAKMGLLITEMIDRKMIHAVVSTGALMAHGLIEGLGKPHFKYDESMNDRTLYDHGYDRVYDTLETEKNFDELWDVFVEIFGKPDPGRQYSSSYICAQIGKHLQSSPHRAILKSAVANNVPVYIPAFTDSELGMDFALMNRELSKRGQTPMIYNPLLDLDHFADLMVKQKRIGIFTIGGGVPRNWAQQVCPYLDSLRYLFRDNSNPGKYYIEDKNDPYNKLYQYAVRICPEPVHWGGLSGCTYREGVSWGKFLPPEEGGRFAEVLTDATTVWPLLIKGVIERMKKKGMEAAKKNLPYVEIR